MEKTALLKNGTEYLTLPCTNSTLRNQPLLRRREPLINETISPGMIQEGNEITGCIVCRLTKDCVPDLFKIILNRTTEEGHVSGTKGLFRHKLTPGNPEDVIFTLVRETESERTVYPDLVYTGYELRAVRGKPVYLRIDVSGETEIVAEDNPVKLSEITNGRFFFFNGDEILINDKEINDISGFHLMLEIKETQINLKLILQRKETTNSDFRVMRNDLNVGMNFTVPDEYEPGRKGTFQLSVKDAVFTGEESFQDDEGTWGRESRYCLTEQIEAVVYTETEGI